VLALVLLLVPVALEAGLVNNDTPPIVLALVPLLGLVAYLLSFMTPARTPVVRMLQVLIIMLLSVPIGAALGAGLGYFIGMAAYDDIRRLLVGAPPRPFGLGPIALEALIMTFGAVFLGGSLGLAVGVRRATTLWTHIDPTSTARHDAEGLGKKKISQSDLV